MKKRKIFLSATHVSPSVNKYVSRALSSNELSYYGENIEDFERALKSYLGGNKEVVLLNSGTSAIHLALIQLGVSHGDEVICQTNTFCATANPIKYVGAEPIFVDSEPQTWNICPKHLETAIKNRLEKGRKPKAIIIVHAYGMPAMIDELLMISNKYNIPIIEDAAEALGSSHRGQKCGTFGDYSIISFNGNKVITSSGGGALICNSTEEKENIIYYATQAREAKKFYYHNNIGYNYRMSNLNAGVGLGQMEVLNDYIKKRREINLFYRSVFKDIEGVNVFTENRDYVFSNFWLNCIFFDEKTAPFTKEELLKKFEEENIETKLLWKPMHKQPIYKGSMYFGYGESEKLFSSGLCLPSGSILSEEDLFRIKRTIETI
ncbi:dTDP-4-amino-4,6-dideoxygalactose transaminase [Winogradskyella wandonensis]|uniref:dTDP-4-amino-4,6-dideoxygalactose transaminase n=1 Tax=Winogradskyella wandonensis TaxID=1442586 RepID=A0A4R1KTB4_9FLAO|nr:aminotransferase class I/II-fold pyridoxal phosphate-dependent enzyme [Winogradskyella wandonensis]TCK67797.1 dTDP-4-amino-4,6-dideoxygalactose transaminase [Winogradskyella wandonensis]